MPRGYGYYPRAMDQLREEFGGKCQAEEELGERCEVREGLEFAHKRPTRLWGRGRGQSRRVHDIRKNRGDYCLLCRGHHKRQEMRLATMRIAARPVFRERVPGEDDDEG